MSARQRLFCDAGLAARIEHSEAGRMAAASEAARERGGQPAGFVIPIAGGIATFASAGSPYSKVAGLGFGGVPDRAELTEVERAFAARGTPVQAEVANLADPAVGAALTERGYRLVSFENVLGRDADADAAGCGIAVVTTQPGSVSQRNVQRSGFDLLCTRAVLVKPVSPPPPQSSA